MSCGRDCLRVRGFKCDSDGGLRREMKVDMGDREDKEALFATIAGGRSI